MSEEPRREDEDEELEAAETEVESDEVKVEETEPAGPAEGGEAPPEPDDDVEAAEAEVESDEAKVEGSVVAEEAQDAPAAEQPRRRRRRGRSGAGSGEGEAAPAPAASTGSGRRRDRRPAADPGVVVRAQARYVRTSARKARLVCDHIRGKDVEEARAILAFTPRGAARAWSKLLDSAVANAEHNHELVGEELMIASVYADEGPTLKRFRPRAMGRATRIRKRTSHLTITLTPKG
jgi:ribosomal protein L22